MSASGCISISEQVKAGGPCALVLQVLMPRRRGGISPLPPCSDLARVTPFHRFPHGILAEPTSLCSADFKNPSLHCTGPLR
jgi:hypothetical protein